MAVSDKNIKQNVSPGITLFVVSVVQFITPFMFSAVGIALPTIGLEFQASAVQLGLIEMIYILAFALFLLPLGRFADIFGAAMNVQTSLTEICIVLVLLGFGFGLFSTPNMTAIMGSVQPRHYGVASSMVATMRSAGMLTSMTIITIIISLFMGNDSITQDNQILFISSMHTALITFSIMSFAGIAFSLGRLRLR